MSQPKPSFFDSPYFVMETDNWHLKENAPEELKKEFHEYMSEPIKINLVKAFSKEQGYDDVLYLGKWKDYDVYEPVFRGEKVSIVGIPLVILVKDETVRMSTMEEAFEQLNNRKK